MEPAELKAWRLHLGYSRAVAAEVLGVSADSIVNFEAGVRRDTGKPVVIPNYIELACIAHLVGHRPGELKKLLAMAPPQSKRFGTD